MDVGSHTFELTTITGGKGSIDTSILASSSTLAPAEASTFPSCSKDIRFVSVTGEFLQ